MGQKSVPTALRYSQTLGEPSIESPQNIYAACIQDDWTVNDRLTLNLGLRYDLETGSLANDLEAPLLQPNFSNDANNLQPRVGFAYGLRENSQTILRGGAGKSYSNAFLNIHLFARERTVQESSA